MANQKTNISGDPDLARFGKLLHQASGIHLGQRKSGLLSSRLGKRMKALGLDSLKQYYQRVTGDTTGGELEQLVDCLTTNKTEFFRETAHFRHFQKVALPELKASPHRQGEPLRVWSAACSSGEEAYSLSLCGLEALGEGAPLKVLGTDISGRMIQKALEGWYEAEKVRPIPPPLREKYLQREDLEGHKGFRVAPTLKKYAFFSRLNLNDGDFPFRHPMDVIFCRNVMIYFGRPSQGNLVGRLAALLRRGGYLYTGLSESLIGVDHPLQMVEPSVYQKP